MVAENSNDDRVDSSVDELSSVESKCEQYIELYRNGSAPSFEQFAARHPELESQILELLPTIVMMEGARSRSLERRKDGRVMSGPEQVKKLDDYRIIRELGRGGMGIVYEAHQISLNRLVAIKLLPKYMLSDEQVLKFKLEASTAAKLHHTNIAPIYGVGESSGYHYYAMQLLEGVSLDHCVSPGAEFPAPDRQLTVEEVSHIGRQVASALQYAHEQGVLHRDIKPSNLIMESSGNVWMTDFGLAISTDSVSVGTVGSASGTLRYMAPEKLDEVPDDATGDIYALGITLIELLTGRPAFGSARIGDLMSDIRSGNLDPLVHKEKKLPGDLEAVLRKSVAVDPSLRYQSAGAFEQDLKNAFETRPVAAKPASMTGNAWRWIKRNRGLAAASAIALEMLIATSIISTLAYFRVKNSLEGETDHRIRAQKYSNVATDAMDRMFRQFSVMGTLETNQTYPQLTKESAKLAKQLSDFYSQLASENVEDKRLHTKALAARARVGELNERMGNYTEAAEAFRSAIRGYEYLMDQQRIPRSVEYTIEIARLINQLGRIRNTSGEIAAAEAEHQKAIDLLDAKIKLAQQPDRRVQLELARSYYFKAKRTRPGMGPNSYPPASFSALAMEDPDVADDSRFALNPSRLSALQKAINILNQLTVADGSPEHGEDSKEPISDSEDERLTDEDLAERATADAARLMLALCYREMTNDNLSQRTDWDDRHRQDAIGILESLVADRPTEAVFKFELMVTLAQMNVFESERPSRETLEYAYESVKRAIEIGDELRKSQSGVAIYQIEQIQSRFKLGRLAELLAESPESDSPEGRRTALLEEQADEWLRAIMDQVSLARKYPDAPGYRVWAIRFMLSYAGCEAIQAKPAVRNRVLVRASRFLERLPLEAKQKPELEWLIRESDQMHRQTLILSDSQALEN